MIVNHHKSFICILWVGVSTSVYLWVHVLKKKKEGFYNKTGLLMVKPLGQASTAGNGFLYSVLMKMKFVRIYVLLNFELSAEPDSVEICLNIKKKNAFFFFKKLFIL